MYLKNITEIPALPISSNLEILLPRVDNVFAIREFLLSRSKGQSSPIIQNQSVQTESINIGDRSPDRNDEWRCSEQELVMKFVDLIETCYSNPNLKVTNIANELNISERQLHRKLKVLLNISPKDYLRNHRLEIAAKRLKQGARASEVGYSTGFSSHSYFSRCFKMKYGHSPSNYMGAEQDEI